MLSYAAREGISDVTRYVFYYQYFFFPVGKEKCKRPPSHAVKYVDVCGRCTVNKEK
jgi:hypothetical protein